MVSIIMQAKHWKSIQTVGQLGLSQNAGRTLEVIETVGKLGLYHNTGQTLEVHSDSSESSLT